MTRAAENLANIHGGMYFPYWKPTERVANRPTDTLLAQQYILDVMTGLSNRVTYSPTELRQLYESGYHPAFFGKESPPSNNLLATKALYVLPRLVMTEHIPLLANADIHFTDNAKDFYNQENGNINTFIPDKRARVYRLDKDKNSRTHITYLLRHSYADNYIDAFELVSFLAFTEFFKKQILTCNFNFEDKEGKELEKNLKALGFNKDSIILWAGTQNQGQGHGLFLSPSNQFSLLSPWNTYTKASSDSLGEFWGHDNDVIEDAVLTIEKSLGKIHGKMPDHVIMGNDFSIPLMATLGLFNHNDIDLVFELASSDNPDPERQTLNREEIEREVAHLPDEIDKNTIRKFRVYQYLNLYTGHNPVLIDMRRMLDSTVNKMRNRIVSAGATGLGSPVDIIDFSQLDKGLIEQIEQPKIRELILGLHAKKAQILSLSYPLGENIHPLVKLLNQKLGIRNIGFLGKVGAVIDENGEGVQRGQIVIPEFYIRVGETGETAIYEFRNQIHEKDVILIPAAKSVEVILATNSVLLQTAEDIKITREMAKKLREKPKILLDSESFYLQEVCKELGINPAVVYYVSDNTNIDGSLDRDMSKRMGAEATLAVLEAPLSILKNWLTTF